jgi:hypothetical protein
MKVTKVDRWRILGVWSTGDGEKERSDGMDVRI